MITNNVNFKGVKRNLNVYRIHDFIFHICKFKTHQPFQVQPHFSPRLIPSKSGAKHPHK
ncbi:hypothetical protein Scep_006688 [Stephania cephalantha]|uniref:Uncharacterized protein n=1 Tax=Stephania cephalantha TaxID=152367 RepID=A0AAP0K8P0_9MAGN